MNGGGSDGIIRPISARIDMYRSLLLVAVVGGAAAFLAPGVMHPTSTLVSPRAAAPLSSAQPQAFLMQDMATAEAAAAGTFFDAALDNPYIKEDESIAPARKCNGCFG